MTLIEWLQLPAENWTDPLTRNAFADWLEENGCPNKAKLIRSIVIDAIGDYPLNVGVPLTVHQIRIGDLKDVQYSSFDLDLALNWLSNWICALFRFSKADLSEGQLNFETIELTATKLPALIPVPNELFGEI